MKKKNDKKKKKKMRYIGLIDVYTLALPIY